MLPVTYDTTLGQNTKPLDVISDGTHVEATVTIGNVVRFANGDYGVMLNGPDGQMGIARASRAVMRQFGFTLRLGLTIVTVRGVVRWHGAVPRIEIRHAH